MSQQAEVTTYGILSLIIQNMNRKIDENQVLTNLNAFSAVSSLDHQFQYVKLVVDCPKIPKKQPAMEQPQPPPIQHLISHHAQIEHVFIQYEPTDNISVLSQHQSQRADDVPPEAPKQKSFLLTFQDKAQQRFNIEEALIKLNQQHQNEQILHQDDVMRKKLYEKRRQLKIKNQLQRESKKKIPIGKNEKITFDFDGSLMRMDNHHIKIKDAVRMKADSSVDSQKMVKQTDPNVSLISSRRHVDPQPQAASTRSRFYNNDNHRQTSHIPHIKLANSIRLTQENETKEGAIFNKVTRQDFEQNLPLQQFRHHSVREELQDMHLSVKESTENDQQEAYRSNAEIRLARQISLLSSGSSMPKRKSYNFQAVIQPARDTPLQRYYRYDYDEEAKKMPISDKLLPLTSRRGSLQTHNKSLQAGGSTLVSTDRIITNSSLCDPFLFN